MMMKSLLRDGTESAEFVTEVAKQHDVFAGEFTFGVLVNVRVETLRVIRRRFAKTGTFSTDWVVVIEKINQAIIWN